MEAGTLKAVQDQTIPGNLYFNLFTAVNRNYLPFMQSSNDFLF
jgi:hypothetical protein